MTDRDSLYRAICDQPAADLPRLAFADYLDDHGDQEDDADRAAFIRAQIEYAKWPSVCQKTAEMLSPVILEKKFYRSRCRCVVCRPRCRAYYSCRKWIGLRWTRYDVEGIGYRHDHGFPSIVRGSLSPWLAFETAIRDRNPITHLHLVLGTQLVQLRDRVVDLGKANTTELHRGYLESIVKSAQGLGTVLIEGLARRQWDEASQMFTEAGYVGKLMLSHPEKFNLLEFQGM